MITKLKRFLQQEQIAFEIRNIEDMSIHQIRDQIHPETSQPKITEQKKLVNEIIKGLETERKQKEKQLAQAYEE
ncbi:10483_t:CDS:2 [Gigaspora margarita]|uniref:10483_t:CDS:1 n=1 Tax=Gigaspora margarita TaxID=4874 RepID=A0ABM8VWP0_GIGMA|nr:10483_t:CDS:2 [Gigaspora margarita]